MKRLNVLFVGAGGRLAGAERCQLEATNALQLGYPWDYFVVVFGAARLTQEGAKD